MDICVDNLRLLFLLRSLGTTKGIPIHRVLCFFLGLRVAVSLFLVLCQVPLNRPFEPSRSPLLYIVSLPPSDLKAMHIFCRSCHSIVFVAKRRFQKPYFAI